MSDFYGLHLSRMRHKKNVHTTYTDIICILLYIIYYMYINYMCVIKIINHETLPRIYYIEKKKYDISSCYYTDPGDSGAVLK